MQSIGVSLISLFIAMTSIQFGASVAKQLFPIAGSVGTSFMRLSFATLILLGIWRPWKRSLNQENRKAVVLYGLSLGFMNLLFYLAIERIPLGIGVAVEFIGPLMIALHSSRRWTDYLWIVLAAFGIILILPLKGTSDSVDLLGVLLALGAGICWASYIFFGQKVSKILPGGDAAALGMLVATFVVLPFVGMFHAQRGLFEWGTLKMGLVVALFSSAIPYSLEMIALKNLRAKTFGILMSFEPALAAIAGLVMLKESLTFQQMLAIACIMVASVGCTREPTAAQV